MEAKVAAAPDGQVSLTDPDARSMATSGRGTGIVGYNVQVAVDTQHHLILAHDVVNDGHDRTQLVPMGRQARNHRPGGSWILQRRAGIGVRGHWRAAVRAKD